MAVALGLLAPAQLLHVAGGSVSATSVLIDGLDRGVGVSIFTLLMVGLVAALDVGALLGKVDDGQGSARRPVAAELRIVGWLTAAVVLTTHSVVAILAIGPYASRTGARAGLGPYRRANLLDVTACTWPFLLPFFLPTILAAGTDCRRRRDAAAVAGRRRDCTTRTHGRSIGMLACAIGFGYGRGEGPSARAQDAGAK